MAKSEQTTPAKQAKQAKPDKKRRATKGTQLLLPQRATRSPQSLTVVLLEESKVSAHRHCVMRALRSKEQAVHFPQPGSEARSGLEVAEIPYRDGKQLVRREWPTE